MQIDDDIAALATPPGSAARGVIRICGGNLRQLIADSFQSGGHEPPERDHDVGPKRFTGSWRLSDIAITIPCDLWHWPDHRSYAGQPTVELHLPGSPPLLEKVLEDLYRRDIRPARPGEFTLRAFFAGKIDLVQAEAVLGVIDAQDDTELRLALSQLAGGISQRLLQLRHDLLDLLADLEAGLDFVEEDISFVSREDITARISVAGEFVRSLISQADARMTSATRKKVVLAGLPNAGKSTLFNRLAGGELALVSPVQGTTTDYVRAEVQLAGVDCEVIDTAGWETDIVGIPAAAQELRSEQLQRADLILWCTASDLEESQRHVDDAEFERLHCDTTAVLRVETKSDLPSGGRKPPEYGDLDHGPHNQRVHAPRSKNVAVSAVTDTGLDELAALIATRLISSNSRSSAWLGTTSARCRDSLQHALAALERAAAADLTTGEELLAVDLREALDQLGAVVGAVYTDDLLDRIFSKFCIGK